MTPDSDAQTPSAPHAFSQNIAPASEQGITTMANDIERRLKILEDRYNTLRKKTQTTDETLLTLEKKFSRDSKAINADLLDLKRSLSLMQEKISQFSSEIESTAPRATLKELEAYVSFFEPMQFVTRQDLKAALSQRKQQ